MLPPDLPHIYPGADRPCLDRSSADFNGIGGLSGTSRNRAEERVVEVDKEGQKEETPIFFKSGFDYFFFGGLGAPTDEPLNNPPNCHDIMSFFPNTKDRIFAICAPLYALGHSLREIERQTGFVKTTIKKTLNAGGLALRNYRNRQKPISQDPNVMKAGAIPFGYAHLEGQLVKDPREYKTLLQIQKLWKSGKSCSDIAAVLNNQKTPTRRGKRWGKSVIARILKRQEEQ